MRFSKSVVDDIAVLAPFEMLAAQLWRSFSNCASLGRKCGAVLGDLRHWRQMWRLSLATEPKNTSVYTRQIDIETYEESCLVTSAKMIAAQASAGKERSGRCTPNTDAGLIANAELNPRPL